MMKKEEEEAKLDLSGDLVKGKASLCFIFEIFFS
jgi:hypothetical protein